MNESLRLFVALSPSAAHRHELAQIIQSWEWERGQWRPTPLENLHLTVVFLGSTPATALDQLKHLLQENIAQKAAVTLVFDTLFTLPPHSPPRVLALKPRTVPPELPQLYQDVTAIINRLQQHHPLPQYQAEKKGFLPHLTLARAREGAKFPRELKDVLKKKPLHITFTDLELYQSQLLPQGAKYQSLWHKRLLVPTE